MSRRRFYSDKLIDDNSIAIVEDELHHLKNVIRLKIGDEVEIINGKGILYLGKIKTLNHKEAVIQITEITENPQPNPRFIFAPPLLKKKHMSLMVEKLTEIGMDEIRPIIFNRTEEKYQANQLRKWQQLACQSLKINKNLWVCQIFPPVDIKKFINNLNFRESSKILLDKDGQKEFPPPHYPIITIIGPPGDYIPEEKDLLCQHGFVPVKINHNTLRSETAAISMAAILSQQING